MKTLNFFLVSAIIFLCVFFAFTQGNVGIGTAVPVSRFTIKGDSTDIRMDLNSTSIKTTQDLKFAVDNVERSTIQHDKITNSLVIDVDKNDQNSGDIVFKKHGDDRLAIRNNGDFVFKRYGDDRLAIIGVNGNVGIGTSIPNSRLTIKGEETDIRMDLNLGSTSTTQGIQFAVEGIERSSVQLDKTSNNLTFDVDKNGQNTGDIVFKRYGDERLAIRNNGDVQFKKHGYDRLAIRGDNGNVGIGTSIPSSRLTIKGEETNIRMDLNLGSTGTTEGIQFAVDGIDRSSIQLDKISNNLTFDVDKNDQNTGDIVFKRYGDERLAIRNNGDVQFKKHGDDRLAIIGVNGNVGIGTSIPASRLTIKGNETDIQLNMDLASPSATQGIMFVVGDIERSSVQLDKISNNLTFDVDKNGQNTGDIVFKRYGDERLAIRNNGDVQFKKHGDDRLAIRGDNGNVGIGTSIPASRLTIKGEETNIRMDLNLGSTSTTQGIQFAVEGIERSSVQLDKISNNLTFDVDKNGQNTGDIVFKRYGDERLAIRNNGDVVFKRYGDDRLAIRGDNGNVGIGTSNPVTKLDVNGSVKVANDMTPPGPLNAGAIRYRVEGNSSICEMVMQTGPVNYAWVIIRVNTW